MLHGRYRTQRLFSEARRPKSDMVTLWSLMYGLHIRVKAQSIGESFMRSAQASSEPARNECPSAYIIAELSPTSALMSMAG